MAGPPPKEDLRSATPTNGGLSVTISGTAMMLKWLAISLDTVLMVSAYTERLMAFLSQVRPFYPITYPSIRL
jgi:hypothetical protein